MKKSIAIFTLCFSSFGFLLAQFPQGINYQGVARDANGNAKTNQPVPVQFTIYQSTAAGTMVWQERQVKTTNSMGQFNAIIGTGAPVTPFTAASFSQINWGSDSTFLKIEINSNVSFTGVFSQIGSTTKFQAVPYALSAKMTAPTVQRFLSGSGTYTVSAGVLYIEVEMVGGGGSGGGSNGGGGSGSNGTGTTFGTSLLTANFGYGGPVGAAGNITGGIGGTGVVNSPAISLISITGGSGSGGTSAPASGWAGGGTGGNSTFGGAGGSASNAANNSGSGGGGGGGVQVYPGNGGGAGGYIRAMINNPSASYPYSIGAGGSGGSGNGGSGIIIIKEYYK